MNNIKSRLAQLVERVTSNDEVSRSSRLMGIFWSRQRSCRMNLKWVGYDNLVPDDVYTPTCHPLIEVPTHSGGAFSDF